MGLILLSACSSDAIEPTQDSRTVVETHDTAGDEDCITESTDCTCIVEPNQPEMACWHDHGGRYADGACSANSQCCAGEWTETGSCGECSCTQSTGTDGCVPENDGTEICFPRFEAQILPISDALRSNMTGVSWHEGCPVSLSELSELQMSHWDSTGKIKTGSLIVATNVAETVRDSFSHAYNWRFIIQRMEPVYHYGGSDDESMAANNTSAFNCRAITGGSSWSQHSYGNAIDINPVQNPYVSGSLILPPEGAAYVERDSSIPGLIFAPGPVTGPFLRRGWGWGGS